MSMPLSLEQIMTNAASGMSAQSIRMNTIASNLANSDSVGTTEADTYHTKYPIFTEVRKKIQGADFNDQPVGGVEVTGIQHSTKPLESKYEPDNPLANGEGMVYLTDVNPVEEMTNMIAASKEYQANIEMVNTTKNLILRTLDVMRS
ncbi:MAG: flagellar basal body rod protein FlgC [Gammaproteobacteria bacterium]